MKRLLPVLLCFIFACDTEVGMTYGDVCELDNSEFIYMQLRDISTDPQQVIALQDTDIVQVNNIPVIVNIADPTGSVEIPCFVKGENNYLTAVVEGYQAVVNRVIKTRDNTFSFALTPDSTTCDECEVCETCDIGAVSDDAFFDFCYERYFDTAMNPGVIDGRDLCCLIVGDGAVPCLP